MAEISVTRALTEIKHLADRIARANATQFIGVAKGKGTHQTCFTIPSESVGVFSNNVKINLQAALDLISRRERLKREIIRSNAVTDVIIAGNTMTVADAIEKKASIQFTKNLVTVLKQQLAASNLIVEKANAKLLEEINTAVANAYGSDKGVVTDKSDSVHQYEAIAEPRQNRSELSLIDPNGVFALINKLEDEISAFMQEVDFSLSESNSRTVIDVD